MAQYQCRVVSVIAINEAVMDELEKWAMCPIALFIWRKISMAVSNVDLTLWR